MCCAYAGGCMCMLIKIHDDMTQITGYVTHLLRRAFNERKGREGVGEIQWQYAYYFNAILFIHNQNISTMTSLTRICLTTILYPTINNDHELIDYYYAQYRTAFTEIFKHFNFFRAIGWIEKEYLCWIAATRKNSKSSQENWTPPPELCSNTVHHATVKHFYQILFEKMVW